MDVILKPYDDPGPEPDPVVVIRERLKEAPGQWFTVEGWKPTAPPLGAVRVADELNRALGAGFEVKTLPLRARATAEAHGG